VNATIVQADVLVIGGGAAGCAAALTARRQGARPLLVVKGKMGRSGATPLASALGLPLPVPGPYTLLRALKALYSSVSRVVRLPLPRRYRLALRTVGAYHYWLTEQDYFLDYGLWLHKVFCPQLERTGLYARRDEAGDLVTPRGAFKDFHLHSNGMTGYQFGEARRKEVLNAGIPVMEETTAFALLQGADREVVGALVFDYAAGNLFAIEAKTTIVATGHTNWLATRATGTREMAANGLAMSARAGAECQNLEIQWCHAADMASPSCWMRLHNYPNPLSGSEHRAVMANSSGQEYMRIEDYAVHMPYVIQLKKLYEQVRAGAARWDSGSFANYRLVEPQALEEHQYHWEFYRKLGLSMATDRLECGATWHMTGGGIRADTKTMQTSVPGLYIAGGIGGHTLGSLSFATYDGELAGAHAASAAARMRKPQRDPAQVRAGEEYLNSLLATTDARKAADSVSPIAVKRKIRELVSAGMLYAKTERRLLTLLEGLSDVEERLLPRMRLRDARTHYNWDLVDAIDSRDMLLASRMSARSSLSRAESRGPHFREDYPFTDNVNWLKHVVATVRDNEVCIRLENVPQRYVKPKAERVDYLANPYA
jgi:succinate dehydrogenase / fumarate reductase flavoprotein subunit